MWYLIISFPDLCLLSYFNLLRALKIKLRRQCGAFLLFMFRVCLVFLSVHCSLVFTCWESSLVCDILLCFVTLPCDVLGQVWCLFVSIPDLCLLTLSISAKLSSIGTGHIFIFIVIVIHLKARGFSL